MTAVVAAFNQEKALVGAFSVVMNLRMELFEALLIYYLQVVWLPGAGEGDVRDAEEADVDHLLLGAAAGGEVALEQAGVEL